MTRELLWTHGGHNPSCLQELSRQELQPQVKDREFKILMVKARKIHQKAQYGDKETGALLASLKACAIQKDLCKGSKIHADILQCGLLGNDTFVGTALVNMYAKCGALAKAQELFDELPVRNVVSWNVLIAGYAQHGHGDEALKCFKKMQGEGLSPNVVTFTCILKACGSIGKVENGKEIHDQVVTHVLLKKDIILGNALVDMYAKCGALAKAQEVFDELPMRDVVTWNSLITGYVQCGHGNEALNCFERMQDEGVFLDTVTLIYILKACSSVGAAQKGEQIHTEIVRRGLLGKDIMLGNALVDMYVKFGRFAKALEVFDELPVQNVVSWNVLIAGYAQHGHGYEAFNCFERMQEEGFSPNTVTFTSVFKACSSIGAVEKGKQIHAEVVRQGLLEKDDMLGNVLVDMYAKCGALAKAQEVFDELPAQSVVSCNTLIAGYVQHGSGDAALKSFEQMLAKGFSPNAVTFSCILKACGITGAAEKGEEIHTEVVRQRLLGKDNILGNALVDMYAKCGALVKAKIVFDELAVRDVVSWSVLIAGYAQHGHGDEALICFEHMQNEGLIPNALTFTCALKACGSAGAAEKGKEIHSEVARQGLLEKDIMLSIALVDMYAKCGAIAKAQEMFDKLPRRTIVSWNALIAGYAQHGLGDKALNCFKQMKDEGLSPNVVTFTCILQACGSVRAVEKGEEIHAEVVRQGLLEKDIMLGNALVDMYGKCGALAKAREVFDELSVQDIFSWSALIAGYVQHEHGNEALKIFERMQKEGLSPNAVTFTCALKACGSGGAAVKGEEIHVEVVRWGLLEKDNILGTALVDMYAKCGALAKAQKVFDELSVQNVVSWNVLIAGYGQHGHGDVAVKCFKQMQNKGVYPNSITFTVLLNACSHSGLFDEGQMYFSLMSSSYRIAPTLEHHTCMVDLFGRAGQLEKAIGTIEEMLLPDCYPSWFALLGACHNWGNMKLGRLAFEHVVHLDRDHAGAYVCMSNIYAAAGMLEEVDKVDAMRVETRCMEVLLVG